MPATGSAAKYLLRKKLLLQGILKDKKSFDRLFNALHDAYTNAWDKQLQKAIADALDELREFSPAQIAAFGKSEAAKLMQTIELQAGGQAMQAALRNPTLNYSEALYGLGITEAGISIAFGIPDLDSLKMIKNANMYWIGQHWDGYTQAQFQKVLQDYFKNGMTRDELAKRFAEEFAYFGEKGSKYWELLADHTATKTREMGRVTAYDRADIEAVKVVAHLDSRTTEICRSLHNKIISVKRMKKQRQDYLEACKNMDQEAAKKAWPMMNDTHAANIPESERAPDNIGMPPYHFRCRTITVAVLS